jgi:ADP-heptose:LPS heptosyltransferase
VLVIRSDDRVGNVLLTTPLVRALREGLPHVRIDWLIASRQTGIVRELFLTDELISMDRNRFRRAPWAFLKLLWELRAAGYDAVIDAAHHDSFSLSSAALTRWTRAPIRIGHDRGDAAHFYSHPVAAVAGTEYDVAHKLALLGPLGLRPRGWHLETALGRTSAAQEKARVVLEKAGLGTGRFVVGNPGARKLERRFPPSGFSRIARSIHESTGTRTLVVWGPGEEPLAREVAASAGDAAVLASPTDLQTLAALLRRAGLLLTNDTGPMHLGVACATPVVAVFTTDVVGRWGHPISSFRSVPAWKGTDAAVDAAVREARELLAAGNAAER